MGIYIDKSMEFPRRLIWVFEDLFLGTLVIIISSISKAESILNQTEPIQMSESDNDLAITKEAF